MPEGDVVWGTARRLHDALAGKPLTRGDFRVPRLATADLTGRVVTCAVSRGKHLLTRVEGGLSVHTHLRMDGSWRIRRSSPAPRDPTIRLVLANEAWLCLGYRLGVVELWRTVEEERRLGHLGPDLLGPDWDPAEAARRLREHADRPSARPCWTRPGSPESATSTRPRSCSCAACTPGARSARWTGWRTWSPSPTAS